MKAIELFAGVGGFRIGLERAGHTVVWANEWDKYACDVYDYNHKGESIDRRDITTIPAVDVPAHDLIVGGFPCQAFSVAGKRAGFDETRGTLFFDILRIARHHRTPYLLLENVKGLLSHDGGQTFETIMRALDECGYDAQWQVLNSKDFGVPQNRERVIIVANLRGQSRPEVFPIIGADGADPREVGTAQPAIASSLRSHTGGVDLDDQLIGVINRGEFKSTETALTIDKSYHKGPDNHGQRPMVVQAIDTRQPFSPTVSDTEFATLRATDYKEPKAVRLGSRIRRLTPIECERLQAFPDNWTKYGLKPDGMEYAMSDTQRYKQMGNAVTTNVIAAVAQLLAQTNQGDRTQ